MVELNMNLHKLLEQFHHEPQSGFDLTPIPQEQETFAKVSKGSGRSSLYGANLNTVRNITGVAVLPFQILILALCSRRVSDCHSPRLPLVWWRDHVRF